MNPPPQARSHHPRRGPGRGRFQATVCKFVNASQRLSAEVEARISQAVTQLGWSLNPMARGMNTGLTGNVGIVLQDIRNPHFKSMVKGTAREAAKVQMNLIVADAADAAESREPELAVLKALSRRVDGLIVSARLPPPVIQALLEGSTPVVFYDGPPQRCCDSYQAGRTRGGNKVLGTGAAVKPQGKMPFALANNAQAILDNQPHATGYPQKDTLFPHGFGLSPALTVGVSWPGAAEPPVRIRPATAPPCKA